MKYVLKEFICFNYSTDGVHHGVKLTWHTKLSFVKLKKAAILIQAKKKAHKTLVMYSNVSWNVFFTISFIYWFIQWFSRSHSFCNLKYCVVFIEYSRIILNPLPKHSFLSSTLVSYLKILRSIIPSKAHINGKE